MLIDAIYIVEMNEWLGKIISVMNNVIVYSQIEMLRDKYMEFAEDVTRVNSMRLMAARFAKELSTILKSVDKSEKSE